MPQPLVLSSADPGPARARYASLERELAAREADLAAVKTGLQRLQAQYFERVGALYAELTDLEAAVAVAEIRAGLRPPSDPERDADDRDGGIDRESHAGGPTPSQDLKRVFRDLAKAIHPDLALDEPARCRRHSLMAEANRAYAERDADRLRLILRAWERTPELVFDGDDHAGDRLRLEQRIAGIEQRLIQIDVEMADLEKSAIGRLKRRIDEARAQGWDLFAEMVLQVRREISQARGRLAKITP
jgi:hypothetical protein